MQKDFFQRFKKSICLLFCIFSNLVFGDNLLFYLGEKKQFPLPEDSVVHLGSRKILSVREENGQLILRGRILGNTWLTLDGKNYQVFVLKKPEKEKIFLLDRVLKNMWGLKWVLTDQLEIQGTLNSLEDWLVLSKLSRKKNIDYHFKARLGEGLEEEVRGFFVGLFKGKVLPEIQWHALPRTLIPKSSDLQSYKNILKPFGLIPLVDPHWLNVSPFIKIEIALLEVSRSSSVGLGATPRILEGEPFSFSSLLKFIDFLKAGGKGRVIQHSSLLIQSGQDLKIHSGGQIPFSQYNFQTHQESTKWKKYGLTLDINSKLDRYDNIFLKIVAELSEPGVMLSGGEAPPLKNQRVETAFQLKSGQIIKLFQREKEGRRKGRQGGFLSNIPFISSFSDSGHAYESLQVILIRPERFDRGKKEKKKTDIQNLERKK